MRTERKTEISISDLPGSEKAVLVNEFDASERAEFTCSGPFGVRLSIPGERSAGKVGPVLVSSTQEWISLGGIDLIVTDMVECLPHGEQFGIPLQLEIDLDDSFERSDTAQRGFGPCPCDSSADDTESRRTCSDASGPGSLEADDVPSSNGFAVVYRATPGSPWEQVDPEKVECIVSDERSFVRVQLKHFSATAVAYGEDLNGRSMRNKITFARAVPADSASDDTRDLMVVLLPFVRKNHFLKQVKASLGLMGGKASVGIDRDLIQHHFITTSLPTTFCLNAGGKPQELSLDDSTRGVFCVICGLSLPKESGSRLLCVLRQEVVRARRAMEISLGSVYEPALLGAQVLEDGQNMVQAAMRLVLNTSTPLLGATGS